MTTDRTPPLALAAGQRWREIRETSSYMPGSSAVKARRINRYREVLAVEGDDVRFKISTSGRTATITARAFKAWIKLYGCTLEGGAA